MSKGREMKKIEQQIGRVRSGLGLSTQECERIADSLQALLDVAKAAQDIPMPISERGFLTLEYDDCKDLQAALARLDEL